ncbi:MAG: type II secretion system F family protein [Clostridia bacterium]|nr:type II secretion system F family protein [Clostridia bacterium]
MLGYLVMAMVFLTAYFIFYTLLATVLKKKMVVNIRLSSIAKDSAKDKDDELNQPLFVRIIQPILDDISKTVLKITPKELVSNLEKKVIMAGKPFNTSVKDWINLQVLLMLCLPLITAALGYYIGISIRTIVFIIVIEMGVGILIPNLILSKKVGDRQRQIIKQLPDVLDLLTVSVEAGLGFDGALAKVIDKMPGPLADEFDNVLQEIKVGRQKRDALRDMADRISVQDLTTFIGSVIQADQLGVSIGNVLRLQSEQIRQKRRQRAQEKAMKAPVKMLVPMVLFIFPTIFSVLIGPVIIRVVNTLIK